MRVSTVSDSILERDEEFTVILDLVDGRGGSGVTLGQSIATATILDDDGILFN